MKTEPLLNSKQRNITLAEIIPPAKQLAAADKIRLIRILAEELDTGETIFPLESNKTYSLPTPYNAFGAAEILMKALETEDGQ